MPNSSRPAADSSSSDPIGDSWFLLTISALSDGFSSGSLFFSRLQNRKYGERFRVLRMCEFEHCVVAPQVAMW